MKWTILAAYGVDSFNVNTTKDMLQALKMLATTQDDSIYAETSDGKNVVQYVSVKDWDAFYIVKHYGWKGVDYDMRGIAHIDAKTGGTISCKGYVTPNLIYDVQRALRKG